MELRPVPVVKHVLGAPASFATAGERPWKARLEEVLLGVVPEPGLRAVDLDFVVSPRVGDPLGPDIDNLCEPVLSVLAGRLGWFGGSRTTIRLLRARKQVGPRTGCRITLTNDVEPTPVGDIPVLLDAIWGGPLPRSAQDAPFARWVATELRALPSPGARVGVSLRFAGPINLGDIATGRIKNVIDCLWPLLGGTARAPDDARVTVLEATRDDTSVDGTVRVVVAAQGQTRPTVVS